MKYDWDDAKSCYEAGMFYFSNEARNRDQINKGINLLKQACKLGSPEASFMMGKLAWEGYIEPKKGVKKDEALKLLFYAASKGVLQAKVMLNEICEERYWEKFGAMQESVQQGPLTDFDGKKINIKCKGLRTPVDAVLKYEDGKNILTFKAYVNIICDGEELLPEELRRTILDGMREWAGDYTVFGGQALTVVVDVEESSKFFDTLDVYIMDDGMQELMQDVAKAISGIVGTKAITNTNALIERQASFAAFHKDWAVKGKKSVFLRCTKDDYDNYEKIRSVVKHEFGHVLGLGDLYYEKEKGFDGVEKGTYEELNSYHISDKLYNLVMCSNHGAISNNDIEMIVLAFSEDEMQRYQSTDWNYDISKALGKGN